MGLDLLRIESFGQRPREQAQHHLHRRHADAEIRGVHDGLPRGIRPQERELGVRVAGGADDQRGFHRRRLVEQSLERAGQREVDDDAADGMHRGQAVLGREGQARMHGARGTTAARFGDQRGEAAIRRPVDQVHDESAHAPVGTVDGDGDHAATSTSRASSSPSCAS
jgi:hypothetical protein